jgi:threonine synthase
VETITSVFERTRYILDPHAAVAYRALARHSGKGIILGTAHPAKFLDAFPPALREAIPIPPSLAEVMARQKQSIRLGNSLEELKAFLRH